jgi:hypothetical protein
MNDYMNAIGTVRVVKHDLAGNMIYEQTFKNQLTNYARQTSATLWTGVIVDTPTLIAVGTGSGTISPTDLTMWTELAGTRVGLDYATTFLQYYSQFAVHYDQTAALAPITGPNPTGLITISEAGLFDIDGNMWSHVALSGVTHDNQSTLSVVWQILHNGN